MGMDLKTNQPIAVSNAPGNQSEAAISGPIVVWQDSSHSCPTCEADILGKNLDTGATFVVADGPADQSHPAIVGRSVAWLELNGKSIKLMLKNLDSSAVVEVASVTGSSGTTFSRPAMSEEYIVWNQTPKISATEKVVTSQLRAYNLKTGVVKTVAEYNTLGVTFAVADHRVVWTDPDLHMTDLETGQSSFLYRGVTTTPAISGDIVVWSMTSTPDADSLDLWGMKLRNLKPVPLVTDMGSKVNPLIIGEQLFWQNDGGINNGRITNTSVSTAFVTAPAREDAVKQKMLKEAANRSQPPSANNGASPSYTNPTYKGIHAAVGNGWNTYENGNWQPCRNNNTYCPAIDSLGATAPSPYFGSVLALDSEMDYSTGRASPWGPRVANAMSYLQGTDGVRVILRTYPTIAIQTDGSQTPDTVAQQVLVYAGWRNWLRNVQINNEPNLEWPSSCMGCKYGSKTFDWTGLDDYRFYQAINTFYTDAWWSINYYKTNCNPVPGNNCQYLSSYTFWTPPLAETYVVIPYGHKPYDYLEGMIYLYGNLSYHAYPAPWHSGVNGGVNNPVWPRLTTNLQTSITNRNLRSQITEFGWDPGNMRDCRLGQYSTWPTTGDCPAQDNRTHTFDNDINYFLANERHNAEAVCVFISRGWSDKAEGVYYDGTVRPWFSSYQLSSP